MLSTSEEELSEEEVTEEEVSEENIDEESEKEDGQDSSDCSDEYIEEEEEEEEEEIEELQQKVDNKKESLQHNDTVDLRTELKRRRALRLNMVNKKIIYKYLKKICI